VGGVVAAGAFAVPATAISVNGVSISRDALDQDLATIENNPGFNCYLDADVAVRSDGQTALPSIDGSGRSGTYSTSFVDFWLSEVVNNLLIQDLAAREHLNLDATALSDGRADLVSSITSTLDEAAASSGQNAVCAASGQALVASLPAGFVDSLARSQAAGDVVLAHAAGFGLTTAQLNQYFVAHESQFKTICVSVIQVATEATATTVRAAIEGGESFAAAAKANSTDTTSAPEGGALGCFSANEGAYPTVSTDVSGLAVGTVSQPVANQSTYLLLEPTSYEPAVFGAVVTAVRDAVLGAGSAKASRQLTAFTKTADVSLDPRYGKWSPAVGVGIVPPESPAPANLLAPVK
jgi:hypothetical protein